MAMTDASAMLSVAALWRTLSRSVTRALAPKTARHSVAAFLVVVAAAAPARAQVGGPKYASIVIDASSGSILSGANIDEPRFPASLTKMMTLYMLFEALRDRRVSLNQYVPVSANAASMSPTKLGLVPGSLITVEQAILGLVTKSANDAAAALGEMLGGDEERFAQMMTLRARSIGMTRTTFQNASGLPDWAQSTTARDMAALGRRLIQDFPGYYHYFSTPSFVFAGRVVFNHQRLLQTYPGAEGLKTGYIEASGFNVVTSALRGDTRLVGVVLGGASGAERDRHMSILLDQGFERMGVGPLLARRNERAFPSFIGSAQAATMQLAPVSVTAPVPAPSYVREVQVARPVQRFARPERPISERSITERPIFERRALERPVFERPAAERAASARPQSARSATRRSAPTTTAETPVVRVNRPWLVQPAGQAAKPAKAAASTRPYRG